jgi:hypothetical protein
MGNISNLIVFNNTLSILILTLTALRIYFVFFGIKLNNDIFNPYSVLTWS